MLDKPLDGVTAADVAALIENQIPEGIRLDYKEKLPGGTDDDKKEFLADVSSFANARGGMLVFGVKEKRDAAGQPTGLPESVPALPDVTVDKEIGRLGSIIRDGIEPRIFGVEIRGIGCGAGPVIIVRIPQSFASPHLVNFKKSSRFYARNSSGKHQLDVHEIRVAFSVSESLPARIRDFRADRLAKITAGDTPLPLARGRGLVVLHMVPASAMQPGARVDPALVAGQLAALQPMYTTHGHSGRYNFDGYVVYANRDAKTGETHAYTQVFRHGGLEATESILLQGFREPDKPIVPDPVLEPELFKAVERYCRALGQLQIAGPVFVMLSLLGMKGFRFHLGTWPDPMSPMTPIDRDDLILPEVMMEDMDQRADALLRPVFDQIWQAGGLDSSPNYDAEGRWKDDKRR